MMEVTAQTVISAQNYAELKNMMLSNDEASKNMALTILEQSDFEKSQVFIMCMLKETFSESFKGSSSTFEEKYPELFTKVSVKLKEEDSDISSLSFKKIYELTEKRKNEEELNFLLNVFKEELVSLLTDYGFSFLDYLDITITPKKTQ